VTRRKLNSSNNLMMSSSPAAKRSRLSRRQQRVKGRERDTDREFGWTEAHHYQLDESLDECVSV
jgi:hypothetical protein